MVPTVETVRGPVPVTDLGTTLMHEHVFVLWHDLMQNAPDNWDDEERIEFAVGRLEELRRFGGDTIVDLTVRGIGQSIPRLQRVAARCDVNIVVATGHYSFSGLPPYLYSPALDENGRHVSIDAPTDGPDPIVELFVRDIEVGIGTTGVKAGLIKCVTDAGGVDAGVERLVRATGRAHRRTGVPISTHTHAGTRRGLDQQRILADEGVDLSRVIIGHCGDSTDLEYLEQLIDAGSYLGMDRFGFDAAGSFEQRVGVLVEMCRRGHAEHMVLSHDAACVFHGTEDVPTDHSPNWHWRHLFEAVLPALARAGVTDQQIDQMLVVNPRQIFSERRAYS